MYLGVKWGYTGIADTFSIHEVLPLRLRQIAGLNIPLVTPNPKSQKACETVNALEKLWVQELGYLKLRIAYCVQGFRTWGPDRLLLHHAC